MILTDKAKKDFLKYLDVEENWFNEEYIPLFEHTLIIEWLDTIKCTGFTSLWAYSFGNSYNPFIDNWSDFIKQAILKANEIYNKSLDKRK